MPEKESILTSDPLSKPSKRSSTVSKSIRRWFVNNKKTDAWGHKALNTLHIHIIVSLVLVYACNVIGTICSRSHCIDYHIHIRNAAFGCQYTLFRHDVSMYPTDAVSMNQLMHESHFKFWAPLHYSNLLKTTASKIVVYAYLKIGATFT